MRPRVHLAAHGVDAAALPGARWAVRSPVRRVCGCWASWQSTRMIRAELGDAKRFRTARAVSNYAGVVPRVTASADKSHHGGMTHRGNAHLRWIVGQWAVRLLA